MTEGLSTFRSRVALLSSIDMHELVDVGVIEAGDTAAWARFRDNPYQQFLRLGDAQCEALWTIVKRREQPRAQTGVSDD